MTELDWTPPPEGSLPKPKPVPWKVDEDPRSGEVRIYAVPEVTANRTPIRHIATCPNRSDAEFIVSLYDHHREGL